MIDEKVQYRADDVETDEPVITAESSKDIDPMEWLANERAQSGIVGTVEIDGRTLKIAPITEAEDNRILKASRRPGTGGKIAPDFLLYRRLYVAHSLTKANPATPVTEGMLNDARSGYLSRIQKAIQELSGQEAVVSPDPLGSLT